MSFSEFKSRSINFAKATSPVKSLMKYLDKVYGAVGDYIEDENATAKCLYFQDASMKDIFNFYPHRICIDCRFKSFEIDIYMYLFLCEDSNGRNYIIAVGFLQKDDIESLHWLFDTFKRHNPNWRKIKFIVLDPVIKQRELVKEFFPLTLVIICFHHAFELFKSFLNGLSALNIISDQHRSCATDLFKNLFHASSQSEFELYYQQYLTLPEALVSHLLDVWIPKQLEWRIPLDYAQENIFLNLNLFLENLDKGVESLLSAEKNSIEFIKKLFLLILLKKKEKPEMFLYPVSFLYSRFSPEYQISQALTPYAAKFVIEQLDLSADVSTAHNVLSETYDFDYLGLLVSASATACSCLFYLLTLLPCRHIFAVRKINYFCVFDESLVDHTWNMKYYEHSTACMQGYLSHSTGSRIPQDSASRATFSSHLFEICASSLLELPADIYESRIRVLKNLVQAWTMNDDVSLRFIGMERPFKIEDKELFHKRPPCEYRKQEVQSTRRELTFSPKIHILSKEEVKLDNLSPKINQQDDLACKEKGNTSEVDFLCQSKNSLNKINLSIKKTNTVVPSQEDNNLNIADCSKGEKKCFDKCSSPSEVKISSSKIAGCSSQSTHLSITPSPEPSSSCLELKRGKMRGPSSFNSNILKSDHINLPYIFCLICLTKGSCVEWLRSRGFLPSSMKCLCQGEMICRTFARLHDGLAWCCPKQGEKKCFSKRISVRSGTWFEESNMTLEQILTFTYMWLNRYSKSQILSEMAVSSTKYVKWDKFHRRICEMSVNRDQVTLQGYQDPLDTWLEKHAGEDIFLEFLKDAAFVYKKDKIKNSFDSETE